MRPIQLTTKDKHNLEFVKMVLGESNEARNKDIDTILLVWQKQGIVFTSEQIKMIKQCMSPISILKCKRHLQNLRMFMYKAPKEQQQLL